MYKMRLFAVAFVNIVTNSRLFRFAPEIHLLSRTR